MRARFADHIAPALHAQFLPYAAQAFYLILMSGFIYAFRSSWAYDDPFITYRYAQNLAQGAGFVYNPSEHVLSTTTPLFTLLLAFINPFWANLPHAAVLIGSISLAWGGLSLWRLGQTWKTPPVGWIGLGLYPTFPLLLDTLGSEMPLYLAFCLAAVASYAQKRYSLCATFSAFSVLTRPDGILLVSILSIDFIARIRLSEVRTRFPCKPILLFLVISLPWFVFAWFYFSSPIPATLATKQHQASMEISTGFVTGFANLARQYTGSGDQIRQGYILIEVFLAMVGIPAAFLLQPASKHNLLKKPWTWQPLWLSLLTWPVLYFLAYAALRVSGYFWYYAPLAPGFLIASGLGLSGLQRSFSALILRSNRREDLAAGQDDSTKLSVPTYTFAATVLLCVVLSLCQAHTLLTGRQSSDPRFLIYRATGEWLHNNTGSGDYTGALEVGIIGYYAQRPMIDFAGLLQPAVALQLKPGNTYQDAALWAIKNYRPEYVVLHRDIFPLVEQLIHPRCTLVQQFSGVSYHYAGNLDIYHCLNP